MRRALLLLAVLLGCRSEPPASQPVTASVHVAVPADSQVGQVAQYTLWFTLARPAHDSTGAPCSERGLEIRSDSSRHLIPLLYTREAPVPESDSTILVHLSDNCAQGRAYRVNLRTAQPTPVDR